MKKEGIAVIAHILGLIGIIFFPMTMFVLGLICLIAPFAIVAIILNWLGVV